MLDRRAIPAVHGVVCLASPRKPHLTSLLLVRNDELFRLSNVRLVSQQFLTRKQWRCEGAKQLDIRRDTKMRSTVPDDVAPVVTHSLNLRSNTRQRYLAILTDIKLYFAMSAYAIGSDFDDVLRVLSVVKHALQVILGWPVDLYREGVNRPRDETSESMRQQVVDRESMTPRGVQFINLGGQVHLEIAMQNDNKR